VDPRIRKTLARSGRPNSFRADFDAGTLDLNAVLFLIGVQELGQHAREFKKDEKVALMHIAICVVLLPLWLLQGTGARRRRLAALRANVKGLASAGLRKSRNA
jgi:hypothetical protein